MAKALTPDQIIKLRDHRKNQWMDAWADFDDNEAFYDRTFALWPKGDLREQFFPATAAATVDHAVDTQMVTEATVKVEPCKDTDQGRERANRLEKILQEGFRQAFLQEMEPPPRSMWFYEMCHGYDVGQGVVLAFPRDTADPKAAIADGHMPFRIRAPHPKVVLLDPETKQPDEGFVVRKRYVSHLNSLIQGRAKRRIKTSMTNVQGKDWDLVDTTEFYGRAQHDLFVGDARVFTEPNTFEFNPFVQAFSGWGAARGGKEDGPRYHAVGLLRHIKDSLKMEARQMTAKNTALIDAVYAPKTTGDQDPNAIANAIAKGAEYIKGDSRQMGNLPGPQIGPELFNLSAETRQDIESGTYSSINNGQQEAGGDTATGTAIRASNSARKFSTPANQLEYQFTIMAQNFIKLLRKMHEQGYFDGEIRIGSYAAKPEDLDEDCTVTVKFDVRDPVLWMQKLEIGLRLVAAKVLSKRTMRTDYLMVQDDTEEEDRIIEELIEETGPVFEQMAQPIADRMAVGDIWRQLRQQRQFASAGAGGGRGSGLVGPNGKPIGPRQGGAMEMAQDAGRQLREPLTPAIAKPSLTGAEMAGRV